MANNYTQFSTAIAITDDKAEVVLAAIVRALREFLKEGQKTGVYLRDTDLVEDNEIFLSLGGTEIVMEPGQVWIHGDECGDIDVAILVIETIQATLKLNKPHVFSWAHTCSKARIDEFGGGAAKCQRGYQTEAMDANMTVCKLKLKKVRA